MKHNISETVHEDMIAKLKMQKTDYNLSAVPDRLVPK